MLKAWRTTGAAVAVTAALFAAAPSAASADPPALWATADTDLAESSADEITALDPDEAEWSANDEESILPSGEVDTARNSTVDPQKACLFKTMGDYVHVSSSAFEASGHGWWVEVTKCPPGTQALVTVQLEQFINGTWTPAGSPGKDKVRSGGGAGNRATGRATCTSAATTRWRSVVDVDIIGMMDPPDTYTTPERDVSCRH
ncbi:hypothetical protein [Nonomuraea sp. NPDC005650]|uniref:hypothetical protein n=1 Tax=Nonomuraea sp. NPDC005650 TaxID=3157045 RepID=UPI0033BA5C1E